MMTRIAEHPIPGTTRTVRIDLKETYRNGKPGEVYIITREGDLGNGFNYLSAGRPTEPEAREVANFLWTDARDRARAKQSKES
jgi:hypothetical protein